MAWFNVFQDIAIASECIQSSMIIIIISRFSAGNFNIKKESVFSMNEHDNRKLSDPAQLGDISDVCLPMSEAIAALNKRVSDLGSQLDRLALMGAKIHELEQRPELKHRGVWRETESYRECNMVSHAGGLWTARQDTKARPGQSHEWQLIVKSGKAAA